MQKWACMAVRPISNHKAPLRRARLTQFRFGSAPSKARAPKGLGSAVHAWDGKASVRPTGRTGPQVCRTPKTRSHTCVQP
jgi:hypothetical protein